MPRTKRDVAELKKRAINSLVLGIELFNRPHDQGRAEGVLILLHHAFERLLKAVIKDRTGTVHAKGGKYSYGFGKCLEVAQNEIKIISTDERGTLSILDTHRDTATITRKSRKIFFTYKPKQRSRCLTICSTGLSKKVWGT